MRVVVHETIAGGGLADSPLPGGLLAEGRLMLLGLLEDLVRIPGLRLAATRDARVSPDGWPAGVETHVIGGTAAACGPAGEPGSPPASERARPRERRAEGPLEAGTPAEPVLDSLLARSDAALVLAPETGGLLERLTRLVERTGRLVLGASSTAVAIAADKGATAAALEVAGVAVPPGLTVPLALRPVAAAAGRLGYPVVVKPTDGVSGLGATRVGGPAGLAAALERAAAVAGGRAPAVRVERWVEGAAASVALVADGRRAVPLALNGQRLVLGESGALAYAGGVTPLDHPRLAEALDAARRAVEAIDGLAGYVGVDLVLPDDGEPVVVEVNPRLTTAYAGLRLVSPLNLAGLIIAACRDGRLPAGPLPLAGRAAWTTGAAWREESAAAVSGVSAR